MSISPRDTFSLKCLDSADQQLQILRGSIVSGKVDLAPHDITSDDARWAAIDAGSSQIFIKCLQEIKPSKFKTLGVIGPQFLFLEGKKDGVGLATKTAAEDPTLTGTRWTVVDLGGNQVALQCNLLGKSTKSTIGTSGGLQFLRGLQGQDKSHFNLGPKDAIGTHWEIVALGPSEGPNDHPKGPQHS